jgi:hypothetical protein
MGLDSQHTKVIALQQLSSIGVYEQSAVDFPIFSRPGQILTSHKVVGIKQLLDLLRLTRAGVNRQVRAEFGAGWSTACEHASGIASAAGPGP